MTERKCGNSFVYKHPCAIDAEYLSYQQETTFVKIMRSVDCIAQKGAALNLLDQ